MLNNDLKLDKYLIDGAYARLMIANDGLVVDDLPQALQAVVSSDLNPVLAYITLLSQFDEMMIAQTPNSTLTRTPLPPPLHKPVLPSHLHRLVGQILADGQLVQVVRTLMMIEERGYGVPPTVWLPPKSMTTKFDGSQDGCDNFEGELPHDYLMWCAWVNGQHTKSVLDDEILSADNWDEWYPSVRIRSLEALRRTNPKTALELIAQFAPKESAERRLDLVAVLAVGLSDEDKQFLQSLSKDRSQKVKDEAKLLLARLGVYDDNDPVVDELFEELEFGADGITFKRTKNQKQNKNRFEYLQKVNLFALAKKFELSLKDFLLAWDFDNNDKNSGHYACNNILSSRVIELLSDDELVEIADFFITTSIKKDGTYRWGLVRPRLPLAIRQDFAHKQFVKGKSFSYLLKITPNMLDVSFKTLQVSTSYKALAQDILQWQKKNADYSTYINSGKLSDQLQALGLMVNQDTAKDCLVALYELGVDKTDPALQTLTLNALLDPLL